MKMRPVKRIPIVLILVLFLAMAAPALAQNVSLDAVCRQKSLTPQQCQALKDQVSAMINAQGEAKAPAAEALNIKAEEIRKFRDLKPEDVRRGRELIEKAAPGGMEVRRTREVQVLREPQEPKGKTLFERSRPARKFQDISEDLKPFGYEFFQEAAVSVTADRKDIPVPMNYIVGPGDEVKILLWGRINAAHNLAVDRDGKITLPQIGPIFVAGMTFEEMSKKVITQAQQIVGASVDISMGSLKTIPIFVLGDVRRPGAYTIGSFATITDALLIAGGPTDIGSMRKVQLRRKGKTVGTFDLYDLFLKGDRSGDMTVQRDDVVFVPVVGPIVGVAGNVRRPAIYELRETLDLKHVFDLAGGIIPSAYLQQIQVSRVQNNERQVVIDLNDRELRKSSGFLLQDADLVRIFSVVEVDLNAVHLEGNVRRPGKYEYKAGMRVRDLIQGVENLLDDTYFDYALIKRTTQPERKTEVLALSLRRVLIDGDEAANVALKPEDRVFVFSRWIFEDKPFATIEGEVRGDCMEVVELPADRLEVDAKAPLKPDKAAKMDKSKKDWTPQAAKIRKIGDDLDRSGHRALSERVLRVADKLEKYGRYDPREDLREVSAEMRKLGMDAVLERVRDIEKEFGASCRFLVTQNLRIRDAILAAGGLTIDADREQAEIVRFQDNREYRTIYFHLGKAMANDPRENHAVQPKDRIVIHSIWEKVPRQFVYVDGEVSRPGIYEYTKNMKVSDLVFKGGGLLESAYRDEAELSSQTVVAGTTGVLSHRKFSLKDALDGKAEANLELRPYDRLMVRRISNWRTERFATVHGEILFEGKYTIKQGERLSALIERAGGYTDKAYLRGAVFRRESVRSLQQATLEEIARRMEKEILAGGALQVSSSLSAEEVSARKVELEQKKKLVELFQQLKATGRMTIHLSHLRILKGSPFDIELENGDSLHIPPRPSVVNVAGAVMSPTSHIFMDSLGYKDYIRLSGGYSSYADEGNIFILKADGSAVKAGDSYIAWSDGRERWQLAAFAERADALEPGDVVVVPERLERIAWLREIRDITQIIMNVAATAGIIIKVF
ncbi:MAG: hypothetical protein CVU61_15680 [Deltaproteobacteria bacterium HGW-Deltaproteobacteria-19]|jgi:protein involved in polysaccharide export with SLBB domain|nr:MAG: hypothetical protein CVU61_15680 [Deltaproteobacteria bacterium HGW-Deltaproteobacteria-19]